ncbi:hypothetical protein CEUSTIGMA_g5880.t1 [Chlamydomonas eustigma]|uniref:Pherophorin domain-containing protein n=1 Tax=Chlamydomonas eustigma TaxID=1157962 RepID=A0A250X682_9CHLO|nr:hypothetical protein CEUSTIGMA_g5880.t1 [Chlamydomonas eustigma]|eukprot:GAX78439.1 hypothetical protein CEUSTIGMA_g5880.t1 [Chlamydomonas eustigma]
MMSSHSPAFAATICGFNLLFSIFTTTFGRAYGQAPIETMFEGTWQGRCTQFAAAEGYNDPVYCVPYSNLAPVTYTYQITYSGLEVTSYQITESDGASNPIVSNMTFMYPRSSDKGNATFSAYTGVNSDLFQACISVSLENKGEASYLAGLSLVNGSLVYNEEGYWRAPGNVPTSQCKTESPLRLYCSDPGVWNYVCQLTKIVYMPTPPLDAIILTPFSANGTSEVTTSSTELDSPPPQHSKPPKSSNKHHKRKPSGKLLL